MALVVEGPVAPPAAERGTTDGLHGRGGVTRKQVSGGREEAKHKKSRWNKAESFGKVVATAIAKERSLAYSLCKTASKAVVHMAGFDDEPEGERPWDDLDDEQMFEVDEELGSQQEDAEEVLAIIPMAFEVPLQLLFTSELPTEALEDLVDMEKMGLTVSWPRGMDAIVADAVIKSRKAGMS